MQMATAEEEAEEVTRQGDKLGRELFDSALEIIRGQAEPLSDSAVCYAICQSTASLLAAAADCGAYGSGQVALDAFKYRVINHMMVALDGLLDKDEDEQSAPEAAATNAPPRRLQ